MESIILIGMPSSGKSTVGKLLAKRRGCPFSDGDDLIRAREKQSLPALIRTYGAEEFIRREEAALLEAPTGAVIATGGSAVYSARAMAHLKAQGKVVYLSLPEQEVERRIPDFTARGVVMRGDISTLKQLYEERVPLYEKYADLTVLCFGKGAEAIAEEIEAGVKKV